MASMFAQYLTEITNDLILETDSGFATYRYVDEKTVYILEIFVLPDYRRHGAASAIADMIVEDAKAKGCTRVLGSVKPSRKGSTNSLKALLGWGMKLDSCADDFLLLNKEIHV